MFQNFTHTTHSFRSIHWGGMVAKNNSVARVRGPRSAARRQHILATTRDLFVKRGFHQTGMAQIASSSGIAVGQIYRDKSEEHTSELQSLMRISYAVFCSKKK